ncbi:hypothetical protein TREMEDRAFT_72651 [Tremella mesenterica DSM 1558]|uniref:uncharacterized protein n=1 Tax=Tremella mesenterica (strain ATCC 24925 / CBS 8224 / DSM 1558 / NBRC 9311 / NRRL Y-6157 / RJB 2259-6 / UBC 559-6) TaxID=578456 RepID=UPI0003F4909F|nr:uncharacterized protein TREMEDRAFT_72651 [Tremella mesenterica DSM 1558]EIW72090.1 hypothetical protein TREMEDRAFT_72651 [Tremella mesenterica DSM 1558]
MVVQTQIHSNQNPSTIPAVPIVQRDPLPQPIYPASSSSSSLTPTATSQTAHTTQCTDLSGSTPTLHSSASEQDKHPTSHPSQVAPIPPVNGIGTLSSSSAVQVLDPQTIEITRQRADWSRWAAKADDLAPFVSKLMGLLALNMFLLGHVILFYPPPSKTETCFHSAPTLWWGVMIVVGVGWFLILQILVVVVIIGLGGALIMNLLRRLRIIPPLPQPEPPRPPPSSTLSYDELILLRSVHYLPALVPTSDSSSTNVPNDSILTDKSDSTHYKGCNRLTLNTGFWHIRGELWDCTKLTRPCVYLTPDEAICVICHENYCQPDGVGEVVYTADVLRFLGCGHLFHQHCIDRWLQRGSGNCPICNQSVRETSLPGWSKIPRRSLPTPRR